MPIRIPSSTYSLVRKATPDTASSADIACSIGLMMLFIVILSLFVFSGQSLRLDESQSLWQTSHSIPSMVKIVAQDIHVPFYHMMLHFWQLSFGNGVASARLLSLIFYLALIPAIYFLGKLIYTREIGLFAAFLMAISPFMNWYGNEIRMYTVFTLVTVLNQYFFMCIFLRRDVDSRNRGLYWVGYAATLYIGMFTHYFFVFNIVTQALFFVLYRNYFPERAFRKFLGILIGAVILFAPWAWYVVSLGSASNTQPQLVQPSSIDLFNTFSQFIFGFQNDHINTIIVSLWPLLVLLIFLSLRRNKKVSPQTVYLFFSLFVPLFLAYAISAGVKPIYLTRYLILSLPALYLLLSWVLTIYSERLARVIRFSLITVMLLMLGIEIVSASTPVKEDYKGAALYLNTHVTPQDVVVLSAPFTIYPVEYYYRGSAELRTLPIWDQTISGPIPAFDETTLPDQVDQLKDSHQMLWLLLSYDQGYEEKVRLYFDTHFERVQHIYFSPDLNLYAYKLRYDDTSLNKMLKNLNTQNQSKPGATPPSSVPTLNSSSTSLEQTPQSTVPVTVIQESAASSSPNSSSSPNVNPDEVQQSKNEPSPEPASGPFTLPLTSIKFINLKSLVQSTKERNLVFR